MTTTFSILELDPLRRLSMEKKGIWKPESPVSLDRLRCVSFPHYNFVSEIHTGEIVVMDVLAPYMLKFFEKLYELHFPIHKAVPMEHYDGSDDASMADNNTSSYNCRTIAGSDSLSLHAYGLAIDLNPVENPYIGNAYINEEKDCGLLEVWPTKGIDYINRKIPSPGMVEPLVGLLHSYGLRDWGGNWTYAMDYHHFQTFRSIAELLAAMSSPHAIAFFEWYVKTGDTPESTMESLVDLYKKNPEGFLKKYSL